MLRTENGSGPYLFIALILATLWPVSVPAGGEGREDEAPIGSYQIRWTSDVDVCEFATGRLNQDLRRNGFNARVHRDPFNTIDWARIEPEQGSSPGEYAVLDIDNNGIDDWILRREAYVDDVMATNWLFVFERPFTRNDVAAMFATSHGSVVLDGEVYPLTKFEQESPEKSAITYFADRGLALEAAFSIHPFLFKGTAYLAIRDHQPSTRRHWTVIAKYLGGHTRSPSLATGLDLQRLNDVCYLERVSSAPRMK